jgi:hypothetical protein
MSQSPGIAGAALQRLEDLVPVSRATDLNQYRGNRTVEQGAIVAERLATLPADGPTGGFFDENGPVPR